MKDPFTCAAADTGDAGLELPAPRTKGIDSIGDEDRTPSTLLFQTLHWEKGWSCLHMDCLDWKGWNFWREAIYKGKRVEIWRVQYGDWNFWLNWGGKLVANCDGGFLGVFWLLWRWGIWRIEARRTIHGSFFPVIFLVFVVARSNVRCEAAIPRNINSLVQRLHPLSNSHVINALFLVEALLKNSSLILKRVQKQDLYLYSFPSILALVGEPTTRPFS